MSAQAYFDAVAEGLSRVREQSEAIRKAADALCDAVVEARGIFSFGASHSFMLTEELVYRTGGLMLINPIYPHGMHLFVRPMTATSQLERVPGLGAALLAGCAARDGDTVIIASTSGRNPVVIDLAASARERGMRTIGITSLAYTGGVSSRHASGRKLADICDIVLDNGAPYGDAAVRIAGFDQRVGPLSSVLGCALVNALVVEVVAGLVARGVEPPVFISANVDGGDERNARLLAANRERIHYMD
ncbi:MAG TPA: SIS domain-containing protein [Chthonomonadales bacterium]|nr:SIS domain-containing protein [Chthonomonadales bacterium]